MITETSYAKLNLTLHIGARRPDGYHDLDTVMQAVSLCDELTLAEADAFSVVCAHPDVPEGEANLCWKAAVAFTSAVGDKKLPPVRITITKKTPVAGGLGGGSGNAAATLRGLNRLTGAGLSTRELCAIAATVGADIPFLVCNQTARCTGIGEKMDFFTPGAPFYYCICASGEGMKTPFMYGEIDKISGRVTGDSNAMCHALKAGDCHAAAAALHNDFDEICCRYRPQAAALKAMLCRYGALGVSLAGSGASVFGLFENAESAENAAEAIKKTANAFAFAVKSLDG